MALIYISIPGDEAVPSHHLIVPFSPHLHFGTTHIHVLGDSVPIPFHLSPHLILPVFYYILHIQISIFSPLILITTHTPLLRVSPPHGVLHLPAPLLDLSRLIGPRTIHSRSLDSGLLLQTLPRATCCVSYTTAHAMHGQLHRFYLSQISPTTRCVSQWVTYAFQPTPPPPFTDGTLHTTLPHCTLTYCACSVCLFLSHISISGSSGWSHHRLGHFQFCTPFLHSFSCLLLPGLSLLGVRTASGKRRSVLGMWTWIANKRQQRSAICRPTSGRSARCYRALDLYFLGAYAHASRTAASRTAPSTPHASLPARMPLCRHLRGPPT